jgi:hypothetical protein
LENQVFKTPFSGRLIDARVVLGRRRATKPVSRTAHADPPAMASPNSDVVPLAELVEVGRGTSLPVKAEYLHRMGAQQPLNLTAVVSRQRSNSTAVAYSDAHAFLNVQDSAERAQLLRELRTKNQWDESRSITLPKPKSAPILYNYYFRNTPRHLFNPSLYPALENYLVVSPRASFPADIAWMLLNSSGFAQRLSKNSRSQGSGLYKTQVYEYRNTLVPDWRTLTKDECLAISCLAFNAINSGHSIHIVRNTIDLWINNQRPEWSAINDKP